jgi:hypothetical protein
MGQYRNYAASSAPGAHLRKMGVFEIGLERIFDDCLVTCHGFLQMKNGLWNEDKRFF